jgi:hypothetical protein
MTIAIKRGGFVRVALIAEGESALVEWRHPSVPATAPRASTPPWTRRGSFGVRRMHSRGKRY